MSFDPIVYIGARVRSLQEYAPEPPEETAVRLGLPAERLIKLDANENPYGPTPRALALLSHYQTAHRYPDPISRRLRRALGEYLNMDPAQILVGNGSDELLDLILKLFRPDAQGNGIAQVIDCPPTFGMYQFYGAANDMTVLNCPRDEQFALDVDAIEALCEHDPQPKVVFVASPNNPDGGPLSDADLERLLALPVLVVLDEAYIEFGGASRVQWTLDRQNLIVLRTFSKWAGLAGLRVGYGVFPLALMDALWRLKSPYNVNALAQAAALATLEDLPAAQASIAQIVIERERVHAALCEMPHVQVYPSAANYLLVKLRGLTSGQVREAMEAEGVLLRYYSGALEGYIRISVGTPAQNNTVLALLQSLRPQGEEDGGEAAF